MKSSGTEKSGEMLFMGFGKVAGPVDVISKVYQIIQVMT